MTSAHVIEIATPKSALLYGIWCGPMRVCRVFIFVHGLGGSVFSRINRGLMPLLIDSQTAVLLFNNRGHDMVARVRRGKKIIVIGAAHEVFTDCIDDIQGAVNFARRRGAQNLYLIGHSTGCQKIAYWAAKKGKNVRGIILLGPVSDYAGAVANHGKSKMARIVKYARNLIRRGKKHELIPPSLWSEELDDAQRFISLYTPDSIEEIFSYAQPKKVPRIFRSVKIPTLVCWAGKDEFADRKPEEITTWFKRHSRAKKFEAHIVPKVPHSFKGSEKQLARAIKTWASK